MNILKIEIGDWFVRLLKLLVNSLPLTVISPVCEEDEDSGAVDRDQPNGIMSTCLVNTLRLLLNITHENG